MKNITDTIARHREENAARDRKYPLRSHLLSNKSHEELGPRVASHTAHGKHSARWESPTHTTEMISKDGETTIYRNQRYPVLNAHAVTRAKIAEAGKAWGQRTLFISLPDGQDLHQFVSATHTT